MAKKKKTQLKPVARGFATTSVPKKVVQEEEPPGGADPVASAGEESAPGPGVLGNGIGPEPVAPVVEEYDPDKAEEQSLQNLVDKLQDKTEKEIVRTIKSIEQDRRFCQTLPTLTLDPAVTDRILELAIESDAGEIPRRIEEVEDKAIARLGITYGALRRLGFTEERVEECLVSIGGLDLDEAFDWLYLHCTEDELGVNSAFGDVGEPRTPRTPRTPAMSMTPRTPSTPLTPLPQPSPTKNYRLDASAAVFIPSSSRAPSALRDELSVDGHGSWKSRILSSYSESNSDSEFADEDPNADYVRLKLQLSDLTRARKQGQDPELVENLRSRLESVKKHYFFREKDAEQQYRLEQEKADASALQIKLRGLSDAATEPDILSPTKRRPPKLKPSAPAKVDATDVFNGSSDEETPGGMFELLQEMPATETTNEGTTIEVRDMSLPKHWSGRTPKVILIETVAKKDRYAIITYRGISGASRVKRAAVSIRWEGKKTQEWSMEDLGCYDTLQAEQYIATVALHSLTFPALEGFALGGTAASGSQTFFRLLPAVFRDVWDELEEKRKAKDDAINRGIWSKLRTIIEPKLDVVSKVNGKNNKHVLEARSEGHFKHPSPTHDLSMEQIKAGFQARQASPNYKQMLEQRNQLPISSYREEIISTLGSSQVLVLSGETGCGKSTQVPSFILEDQLSQGKHCKIYCTEPRRISAISLAQRVSRELGDAPGAVGTPSSLVGYSIRLESNTSKNTRLAFVTNGIALRMLEGGTGSGGYGTAFDEITHIIIDEVHERSIESDFLLIVLKSLLQERSDLKVVLMSATLDAEKIADYFGGCPTIHVPGRTFPVDVQYLEDAVEMTKWTISENSPYARRAHDKYYRSKNRHDWNEDTAAGEDEDDEEATQQNVSLEKRYSTKTAATINLLDDRLIPYDLIVHILEKICFEDKTYLSYSAAILIFMPGMGEIRRLNDLLADHKYFGSEDDFIIYPLHSTVSSESQSAVFDIPPYGVRKIVIATNIAETGITIPDITCVIDSGKHREMRFDEKRQSSRLVETYIAKSNAAQRRGRSGRVQNGLCFHLFTKIRHDTWMAEHPLPELTRLSLSDLALRVKTMRVTLGTSIEDALSRALDPPSQINIQRAVSALVEVRALTTTEEITPLGRLLSKLPTDVHLGKFLLTAATFRCLDPALTIAAALSSKSPFLVPFGAESEADLAKGYFKVENSDFLTIHNAFSSWRTASSKNLRFVKEFCRKNFLSHQNLQTIEELRQQFLGYLIDSSFIQVDRGYIRDLNRARWGRQKTRFVQVPPDYDINSGNATVLHAALAAGLYPKILSIDHMDRKSLKTVANNQPTAFHPSSVNARGTFDFRGNHLSYFTLMHSKKLYAWETGPVDDVALVLLCGECDFKLISNSAFIDRKIKFRISGKANIALKHLRSQMTNLLACQFRGKPLSESQVLWNELAMMVLGKTKIEHDRDDDADRDGPIGPIVVIHSH